MTSPTALTSRNQGRSWLLVVASILVSILLAGFLGSMQTERSADSGLSRRSTYFSDDSGMMAAYLISQELLPSVQRWRRPYLGLTQPDSADGFSTLVLADPLQSLGPSDAEALEEWIAAGGQFILAFDQEWPVRRQRTATRSWLSGRLSRLERQTEQRRSGRDGEPLQDPGEEDSEAAEDSRPDRAAPAPSEQSSQEELPGFLQRLGISQSARIPFVEGESDQLTLQAKLAAEDAVQPLVSVDDQILAAAVEIGQGRAVLIPDARAFSNQALGETPNAVWLMQAIAQWGDGSVAFDEYHQGFGQRRSLWVLIGHFLLTPWGWVALQAGLAGLAYLLIVRRRFGSLLEAAPSDRRGPLELVDARAGLLEAARANRFAVDLIHRSLQLRLSRGLGYAVDIDDPDTRTRLSQGRLGIAEPFRRYVRLRQQLLPRGAIDEKTFAELGRSAGEIVQELKAT